jgi:phosphoglycolate phosphatase-like HAD superfamily hydrolase
MVAGAETLLQGLARRGVRLYAASGTDHADVVHEATLLGVAGYFDGGIYGALDEIEAHSKERIIQRILDDQKLSGESLLVVGDGSVELREAHAHQALALGVASDEVARQGWNTHKVTRLANAMADLLVADFREASQLIALFLDGVIPAGLEHQR